VLVASGNGGIGEKLVIEFGDGIAGAMAQGSLRYVIAYS
jgi:hypothetical protein